MLRSLRFNPVWNAILFLIVLVAFCLTYYSGIISKGPFAIHEWAQADRLSLAINFYDNGMNFFLPAVHNQNAINGITGVEFPLQAWLAALLGHIFGREHISICFRVLDIVLVCTGLFFLFLAGYRATRNFFTSALAPLFLFCSPVFIYYTGNYLPDPVGVSMACIGFFFLFEYLEKETSGSFIRAMIFLTLGTLLKTSIGIYLLGAGGFVLLRTFIRMPGLKGIRSWGPVLLTIIVCCLPVIGYYFYNHYLNERYHSYFFLSQPLPFKSLDDFLEYINHSFKVYWMDEYLILPQYVLGALVMAAGISLMKGSKTGTAIKWLLVIFLTGALIMTWLMGHQLHNHDYYVIAIFFPVIAFAMVTSVIFISREIKDKRGQKVLGITSFAAILMLFFFADFKIYRRFQPDYYPFSQYYSYKWMEGGGDLMKKAGVPQQEQIVVLNDGTVNLGLVYFDRKGYQLLEENWHNSPEQLINYMNSKQLRIAVCKLELLKELEQNHADFRLYFSVLAENGKAAVLQLTR